MESRKILNMIFSEQKNETQSVRNGGEDKSCRLLPPYYAERKFIRSVQLWSFSSASPTIHRYVKFKFLKFSEDLLKFLLSSPPSYLRPQPTGQRLAFSAWHLQRQAYDQFHHTIQTRAKHLKQSTKALEKTPADAVRDICLLTFAALRETNDVPWAQTNGYAD